MNLPQLFANIEAGMVTEVPEAAHSYYDSVRGLTANQRFYIYPDDTIVCLNCVDGSYTATVLHGDDDATFRYHNRGYF